MGHLLVTRVRPAVCLPLSYDDDPIMLALDAWRLSGVEFLMSGLAEGL